MSPRRKHANYRPAELMLTRFANTLLVMNKGKLQTQTGAGRIVTLTMNIQRGKSAQVTVDLLQISTICFISAFTYEWVKTERAGEAGGGRRCECRWFLCGAAAGGKRRMPPAIQMSVMCSASEGAETIPVTVGEGTAGRPTIAGVTHRPKEWMGNVGRKEETISD